MKSKVFPVAIVSFALVFVVPALAQDVEHFVVAKTQRFIQTGTGAPTLQFDDEHQPFRFETSVSPAVSGSVSGASIRLPDGTSRVLQSASDGIWEYHDDFSTKTALDAAFPAGNYTLTITTRNDGTRTPTVNLPAEVYPSTPHVSNWAATQMIVADASFTLMWDAYTGGTSGDFISVEIQSESSTNVSEVFMADHLDASATSVLIPANTLQPGQVYNGRIEFIKLLGLNTNAYPGAQGFTGYSKQLRFRMATVNPAGTLVFSAPTYLVDETATNLLVFVNRLGGSQGTVSVNYSTSDDSADSGDYVTNSGTLTFNPGITTQSFAIALTDDAAIEGYESFRIMLSNPAGGADLGEPSEAVVTIVDDDAPPGPAVNAYILVKGQHFEQAGTNATVAAEHPFRFLSFVAESFRGAVTNATLRLPSGTAVPLFRDEQEGGDVRFEQRFLQKADLDLNFPSGTYTLTMKTLPDGTNTAALMLPADSYPATPRLQNWNEAQEIEPGADFVLRWDAWNAAGSNDFLQVMVEYNDTNGFQQLFQTPEVFSPEALSGTNTFVVIPANTLPGGKTYEVELLFARRTTLNTTNYPGVPGMAGFYKQTRFNVTTLTAAPPQGRIQLATAGFSANENDTNAVIELTRTAGATGEVTVEFATAGGTATAEADFSPLTATVTFADGETNKEVLVPLIDDVVLEGNETVLLTLRDPQGGAILGRSNAVLTVVDNESSAMGVLQFSAPAYNVSETNATATITVNRTGGVSSTVSVDYATEDVSASAGLDYSETGGTLTFAPGISNRTFAVQIINDTLDEITETVNLRLSNPTGGAALGLRNKAVLSITDNDTAGTINFSSTTFRANENAGTAAITVVRSGGAAGAVTIDYATTNGTAIADADYTASAGTLTFGANENSRTFNIPLLDDSSPEGNETIALLLRNPGGGASVGTTNVATLVILDDEATLQFSKAGYTVGEGATNVIVTVQRFGPLNGTATVSYNTSAGSAAQNVDYTSKLGLLVFGPGIANQTISIPINNDTLAEGSETFSVTLGGASGAQLGSMSNAVVTILDNDLGGVLNFSTANFKSGEATTNTIISVNRTNGFASGVSVDFTVFAGTASAGIDFVVTNGTLNFAAGVTNRNFAVRIVNDSLDETNETIGLLLSNPTGGAALGVRSNSILTILDDDSGGILNFGAAAYAVSETGRVATIAVTRTNGAATGVSVDYSIADITASAGLDYTNVSGTLTFTNGETRKTFVVPVIDDALPEGNETARLILSNPTGGAQLGTLSNAMLTILENESTLQFARPVYSVVETGLVANVAVARTGSTNGTVSVSYNTANGTATAGVDYTAKSGALTFAPGVMSQSIAVPIANDTIAEGNESVLLALSNPVGIAFGEQTNATLTIVDDDLGGILRFSAASYNISETGKVATITVLRTGGAASGVKVNFAAMNGNATPGGDYVGTNGLLAFGANETQKNFSIKILDDNLLEGPEVVLLSLSNPQGGATLGAASNAVLTINDNETGVLVRFSTNIYRVSETNNNAQVTVVRSGALGNNVSVNYVVTNGTATNGFNAVSGVLSFGPNQTSNSFMVPIFVNQTADDGKTVNLWLSSPSGGAMLGTLSNATLVIQEPKPVAFISGSQATIYMPQNCPRAMVISNAGPFGSVLTFSLVDDGALAGYLHLGLDPNTLSTAGGAVSGSLPWGNSVTIWRSAREDLGPYSFMQVGPTLYANTPTILNFPPPSTIITTNLPDGLLGAWSGTWAGNSYGRNNPGEAEPSSPVSGTWTMNLQFADIAAGTIAGTLTWSGTDAYWTYIVETNGYITSAIPHPFTANRTISFGPDHTNTCVSLTTMPNNCTRFWLTIDAFCNAPNPSDAFYGPHFQVDVDPEAGTMISQGVGFSAHPYNSENFDTAYSTGVVSGSRNR